MSTRDTILNRLKSCPHIDTESHPFNDQLHVVPSAAESRSSMITRFVRAAEDLAAQVIQVCDLSEAAQEVLSLISGEGQLLGWDLEASGLGIVLDALKSKQIEILEDGENVHFGLTGVDAALAATGSLVLSSGRGKPRGASLLPETHIAILHATQILPDIECWLESVQADEYHRFAAPSNLTILSGPSKTADIAMELVHGMHGPKSLVIILIADARLPEGEE